MGRSGWTGSWAGGGGGGAGAAGGEYVGGAAWAAAAAAAAAARTAWPGWAPAAVAPAPPPPVAPAPPPCISGMDTLMDTRECRLGPTTAIKALAGPPPPALRAVPPRPLDKVSHRYCLSRVRSMGESIDGSTNVSREHNFSSLARRRGMSCCYILLFGANQLNRGGREGVACTCANVVSFIVSR
jgi:hypothetical protein